MAVPKKKTSKSKRNMRRASNGSYKFIVPNVVTDKDSGAYKLAHNICSEGYYNGKKIIEEKIKEVSESGEDNK